MSQYFKQTSDIHTLAGNSKTLIHDFSPKFAHTRYDDRVDGIYHRSSGEKTVRALGGTTTVIGLHFRLFFFNLMD
jgi:hypothetical protein